MIKVLIACGWFFNGGVEKYILNIIDRIDRSKYEIEVVLAGEYLHSNEHALLDRNIKVMHYPFGSMYVQTKAIRKILCEGKYDIVHVMQTNCLLEFPAIFLLAAISARHKYKYKIIAHAHNTEDLTKRRNPIKKAVRTACLHLLKFAFRRADLLAACSYQAGQYMYGFHSNAAVFYNGIELDDFLFPNNCLLPNLREKYSIDYRNVNFVVVARMTDQKNPFFLLDIVDALVRYYPNIKLTWVGTGEMHGDIQRYIDQKKLHDHINLLGVQQKVYEILACCDYFLLPSRMEGAPLVLIEAQAAGLKCFASDRVPNIIDCGGVSFIELDKTADEWAAEIHRQIECEPKATINMDSLKRFDINETVKALSEVYDRLVET